MGSLWGLLEEALGEEEVVEALEVEAAKVEVGHQELRYHWLLEQVVYLLLVALT